MPSEDELNRGSDRQRSEVMDSIIGVLAMHCRRHVIRRLLAGNDTCVFTTEQYRDVYSRENDLGRAEPITLELSRMHLESLGGEVREVKPDVWTSAKG